MRNEIPLSYSLSAGLGLGQTPAIFRELREVLKRKLHKCEKRLAILDSPYSGAGFSFPLALTEKENGYDVTTRILRCWVRLNDFNCKHLLPAISSGKIVVMPRYGLDAVIYAGAACECPELLAEIELAHHALVRVRVVGKKIPPPRYIVPWVPAAAIERVISDEHIAGIRSLRNSRPESVRKFILSEQTLVDRYCVKENGQRKAWKINGTLSVSDMAEQAAELIANDVERHIPA